MKTIYVVMGTTGEYSDNIEWAVVYFTDETDAQTFVTLAEAESRVEYEACQESETVWECRRDVKHSMDPEFRMDYTGTTYFVHEVGLGELPKVDA